MTSNPREWRAAEITIETEGLLLPEATRVFPLGLSMKLFRMYFRIIHPKNKGKMDFCSCSHHQIVESEPTFLSCQLNFLTLRWPIGIPHRGVEKPAGEASERGEDHDSDGMSLECRE